MDPNPIKYGKWLPPDFSTHGDKIDGLIFWMHIVMLLLFVGWGIFFVYCLLRFNRHANPKASYENIKGTFSKYVEIAVIAVELILLGFISFPVWAAYRKSPDELQLKNPVIIRVVAQQFAWNIHYPGPDNTFGRTDISLITDNNALGLDDSDPAAADDIVDINNMRIPTGRPVVVHLRSKDVIHSFFIPVLRVKQDTIPGMDIPIHFEAKETGESDIACAQLCGNGHGRMRGAVKILTPEDYQAWLDSANAEEEFSDDEEMEFSN